MKIRILKTYFNGGFLIIFIWFPYSKVKRMKCSYCSYNSTTKIPTGSLPLDYILTAPMVKTKKKT